MSPRPAKPSPSPAPFTGFADASMAFFHALDEQQTRDWFNEHKAEFEAGWSRPMSSLLAGVRDRIAPAYEGLSLREPKVFRLQRDVRFSLDRTPYKTSVSGMISLKGPGTSTDSPAALYLQLGLENLAGAGLYSMMGPTLERYRAAVLDPQSGAALAKITAGLEAQGCSLGAMETLKTAPRGVDKDHPRIELLKRKGLVVMFPAVPIERITAASFVEWVSARAVEAAPLVRWLNQHTE